MGQLEAMLDVLAAQGFAPLQAAYLEAWLHTGQQVCNISDAAWLCLRHSPGHIDVISIAAAMSWELAHHAENVCLIWVAQTALLY